MNKKSPAKRLLIFFAILAVPGYLLWVHWYGGGDPLWYVSAIVQEKLFGKQYAGSVSCRECHARFYTLWSTSWHGKAQQKYTAEFARDNLLPQENPIVIGEKNYQADIGKGIVTETGPGGTRQYPISQVLGGKNVYYFLTELEKGHLQTLPTGFDSRRRQWFDVPASAVRHHGEHDDSALDWTDRAFTYNTSCYSCHVSQLATNYTPAADSYETTWGEPGINCETCHASAADHVKACKLVGRRNTPADLKIIRWKDFSAEQANASCSFCHAKMTPLTAGFIPGERFFDHFDLATVEDRDYYPDGRELGECYTYTTWRMGPCAKSGNLNCIHCHTSSGRYRFSADSVANNACAPCHQDKVNDPRPHTRHNAAQVRCIDCHMPQTEFGLMRRSDHSLRPPTPAASARYGSPDACILCHTEKKPLWADSCVRRWHKRDFQAPVLYRAALVREARDNNWQRLEAMLAYITDPGREEVYANALVRLLRNCEDPRKWPVLLAATRDPSPLIRASGAEGCTGYYTEEAVSVLVAALRDDYRLVRVRAAAALAGAPRRGLLADPGVRQDISKAENEFMEAVRMRLDNADNRLVLGNYYQARGKIDSAIHEFDAAIRLRPELVSTWVNAALAYNQKGDRKKAEEYLKRAIELDTAFAVTYQNLGLLLGEQHRFAEAAEQYRTALRLDSTLAISAYNLAVISEKGGAIDDAVRYSVHAARVAPRDPNYGYTAAYYLWRQGKNQEAVRALDKMIKDHPSYDEARQLREEILRGTAVRIDD